MNADASGPKHSGGPSATCVSGVSMPISRTRSSRSPMCTSMVSPSTTAFTVAVLPGVAAATPDDDHDDDDAPHPVGSIGDRSATANSVLRDRPDRADPEGQKRVRAVR